MLKQNHRNNRTIPWGRFVVESLFIIVSILLAFSIDAWWDLRKDREREQVLLSSLISDFTENQNQIKSRLQSCSRRLEAVNALLSGPVTPQGSAHSADSIAELLAFLSLVPTFDPVEGALEAVLHSGGFELIRNDSLRFELAGWAGELENFKEVEHDVDRLINTQWLPAIFPIASFPRNPIGQSYGKRIEPQWPFGKEELKDLARRDIENILMDISWHYDLLISFGNYLSEKMDRILELANR